MKLLSIPITCSLHFVYSGVNKKGTPLAWVNKKGTLLDCSKLRMPVPGKLNSSS